MDHTRAAKFADWIVTRPWRVLLVMLLLVLVAASGVRHLTFTNDYRAFFSEDNPQLLAFDALENTYTKNDNVLILLVPDDGDAFTRKTLDTVMWATEEAWQTPYSIRVDSITNFQYTYAEGDDLIVRDLVEDTETLTRQELEKIRKIALAEPLLRKRLISEDSRVTAINITAQLPGIDEFRETPEVTAFARDLVERIKVRQPDLTVYVTGMVLFNNGFAEASQADMTTLVPLSLLVIIIGIGLLLRGWVGTLTTLIIILMSIATAMGLAGWFGIILTPPSSSAPTIVLTLAVADAVHVLVTMFHEMRMGAKKVAALKESLRINLQPIFLTSVTTALGFLSMNFSDAPPFRDLGNIVAIGVVAAFVLSVTVLPALLVLLPVHRPHGQQASVTRMEQLAAFVIRHRTALLWGTGATMALVIAFVPRNELNDVFVEYFDESMDIRIASDFATENLGGLYVNYYSLEATEPGGISEPEFLRVVKEFSDWYRQQDGVEHVYTITDTFLRLNKNMHDDDDDWYRLPEERELAAQYLLLYEMSLPYGLDLNDQINVDKSSTKLAVTLQSLSVKSYLEVERNAQAWLRENAPDSMRAEGTGATTMFSYITERNIRSMLLGTTLALVLISVILMVALRSVKIGLLSLIPNLAPAGMAFGIWGLLVGEVGLALSVIISMTLGIVVDDTVHFLSKYLRARREKGLDAEEAVRYAFSSVGSALWITTAVLIAGFLVLSTSHFRLNSDMGLMTAMTIALALAADFLFLPPLLMKLDKKRDAEATAPA